MSYQVGKVTLNSYLLSDTTSRGFGYLHRHIQLNAKNSSRLKQGTLVISNNPVAGYIIIIQARITYFWNIVTPD